MHELDELREVTGLIRQPPFEDIVSTARRRRRRTVAAVTAVGAVVALVAAGGALLTGTHDVSAPPAQEPATGPMAPKEIVTGEASRLVTGAASLDDPDVRIALWEADCAKCGADGTASKRFAAALTTDGFTNTVYVSIPGLSVQELSVAGEPQGPRIESPAEDLFLVVDTERPAEWLVTVDGTVRRVDRVATELAPSDQRLWFRCRPSDPPAEWRGAPYIDPARMYPWCALDPDSGTAYEWPARWQGSLSLPVSGEDPWGVDELWQPTFAWWEADGQRHRRFLAESPPDARGAVWNSPTGGPLFFVHIGLEPDIDLLTPGSDPGLSTISRKAPDTTAQFDVMTGTPGGALLAVRTRWSGGVAPAGPYHQTTIWRAEDLAAGDFEVVHQSAPTADLAPAQVGWVHEPVIVGDRINVMTPRGVVISDDDGHTWTEVTTWR